MSGSECFYGVRTGFSGVRIEPFCTQIKLVRTQIKLVRRGNKIVPHGDKAPLVVNYMYLYFLFFQFFLVFFFLRRENNNIMKCIISLFFQDIHSELVNYPFNRKRNNIYAKLSLLIPSYGNYF